MPGMDAGFRAHVESGLTTLARCWALTRTDGATFGFTDRIQQVIPQLSWTIEKVNRTYHILFHFSMDICPTHRSPYTVT